MSVIVPRGTWMLVLLVVGASARWATAEEPAPSTVGKRPADVVYVATPHDVVETMLEVAGVTKNDVLYDLGCGDGRIVATAARKYGCKCLGFDINPVRVAESQQNVRKLGVEKLATIQEQDIFELDLAPANVVTLYLLPRLNVKLIPQLDKLAPGSRIVSHDFDMKGVEPDRTIHMTSKEDGVEHQIYLWTTPLKKEKEAKR
jgi:trans-aconitate methyltransferase